MNRRNFLHTPIELCIDHAAAMGYDGFKEVNLIFLKKPQQ